MYDWIKVVHTLAIISWMVGLLYLPRLMVYHAKATPGGELSETLKVMERRLLKAIMTPAMLVSWIAGLWLAWSSGLLVDLPWWFIVKLVLVLVMSGFHGWLAAEVKRFAVDANQRGHVAFRVANEFPTVLMIVVVIMVLVKPFL
jgi:protoporphyrinogen IX oxidase